MISVLVIFVMVSRYSVDNETQQESPNTNTLTMKEPGRIRRSKSTSAEQDIAGMLGRTEAYLSTLERSLSHTITSTVKISSPQDIAHARQLQVPTPSVTEASLASKSQMVPLQSSPKTAMTPSSDASQDSASWFARLTSKLQCLHQRRGAVYLYHVRKAAGTTIRDLLTQSTVRWGVPLYETEGISLPHSSAVVSILSPLYGPP